MNLEEYAASAIKVLCYAITAIMSVYVLVMIVYLALNIFARTA